MSLTISFINLSETFNNTYIDMESDLFGFEICRKQLWGNKRLTDLGCIIIPKLKESDIFIINGELSEVFNDCQIIINNISEISLITNFSEEFIKFRINNLLKFIEVAMSNENDLGINIS